MQMQPFFCLGFNHIFYLPLSLFVFSQRNKTSIENDLIFLPSHCADITGGFIDGLGLVSVLGHFIAGFGY